MSDIIDIAEKAYSKYLKRIYGDLDITKLCKDHIKNNRMIVYDDDYYCLYRFVAMPTEYNSGKKISKTAIVIYHITHEDEIFIIKDMRKSYGNIDIFYIIPRDYDTELYKKYGATILNQSDYNFNNKLFRMVHFPAEKKIELKRDDKLSTFQLIVKWILDGISHLPRII